MAKLRREKFQTSSGIELPNDFHPLNTTHNVYEKDIAEPGSFPYTRGIRTNMYRGKFWTMRQYAGFATAAESNARYKYLLSQGTSGLIVAFDNRHLRVLRSGGAELEHDLYLGLSHSRGRFDRSPGDRVHACRRDLLYTVSHRCRAGSG